MNILRFGSISKRENGRIQISYFEFNSCKIPKGSNIPIEAMKAIIYYLEDELEILKIENKVNG